MEQEKSNAGIVVLAIIITAVVVGGGFYYFQKSTTKTPQTTVETPAVVTTPATQKSLGEYFATRKQFVNNGIVKDPDELGFKELANVAVTCPDSLGTTCGGNLLILSKDSLHSGNQEFYLGFSMLPGAYTYYGPFTDDLQKIVNESKAIKSLVDQNTNQQVTQPQNIVYTNSTYGFTLKFPQTWKDYTAKSRTLDWGTFGTSDSVDFGFSAQDSLFNISVYSKSQWQKIKSEDIPTPMYLGENSQYVFGYATAQDAANNTMVTRMSEVQEIVKTFVVTK